MDQIFFLISSFMSILMLAVVGLLAGRKAFKGMYALLLCLAAGSFGFFFAGVLGGIMSRGHYIFASLSVILGFSLAIAVSILFTWHRLRPLSLSSRERHSQPHQEMIQSDSRYY